MSRMAVPDRESNLVALATHELRTPAAAIHAIAQTLIERAGTLSESQLGELHRSLIDNSDRLTRLIDELLDVARLDAGAVEVRPEPLPLHERLQQLVPLLAGERAAEIDVDAPAGAEVWVDPTAFEVIVSNLVTNALRYGRPPFAITATVEAGSLDLVVDDAGDGVSAAFAPHLFERFSREPRSGGSKGAGLGLAIAQSYARAHGGRLTYEPLQPHGARFRLVLPAG